MESSFSKSRESLWVPLVRFEKNWLQNFISGFKHHYHRRYFDDIFVSFTSPKHLEAFQNFLNGRHANKPFTIEREKQDRMSFFDVQITRKYKAITTCVYLKSNFSGIYTHFDSFLPSTYKFGTYSLLHDCEFAHVGLNYTIN